MDGGGWRGFVREVWDRFNADNLGLFAAAVSFYALLSVPPLLLVGTAALGYVVTPDHAQRLVLGYFSQFVPGESSARALTEAVNVREAVAGIVASRGPAALIGFASLLWASTHVFYHLQAAMNVAWRAPEPRHVLHARALSLASVVAAGGLFLVSLLFTSVLRYLRQLRIDLPLFPGDLTPGAIPLLWELAGFLVTLSLSILAFSFLIRLLPAVRVPTRAALMAGAGVGVVWEIAKQGFAFYLSRFADFNKIYGALGTLVGLALWVNVSVLLLLVGAEISAVWTGRHPEWRDEDE